MIKFEKLHKKQNKLTFLIKNSTPGYSNALRRIILNEVAVMAIDIVEIRKNSSALYDEMISHRLGLLPLTTDLKSYELPKSQSDIDDKKAKYTLQFKLKEKGPKTVYASDLKSADPKVKPVYPKMPIVKLLKDQKLELIAIAILGKGKDHAKWSPCHVWYTYNYNIKINNKSKDLKKFKDKYPAQIFKQGKIDKSLIIKHNLVDAVAHVNENIIKVEYNDSEFIFNVESWGQLKTKEILLQALDIFDNKLNQLKKLI